MWNLKVGLNILLLFYPYLGYSLNRDAYEFLNLEDLKKEEEILPTEEIPEELEGDLNIQENSYHTNRLMPYRPPSEHNPPAINKELNPAQDNEENFFGDIDTLQEKYSELRGRIPPKAKIKYPNHWKRKTLEETLADGNHSVRLKVGARIYDTENHELFTLESTKYAWASRAHDSDGMIYLADKQGAFRFKTYQVHVEDLSPLVESLPAPKKFEMYDRHHSLDFYDRKTQIFIGPHIGAMGESAPYLKDSAGGPVPYSQGITIENTVFFPWRVPFYPGLRFRYDTFNFKNTDTREISGHVILIGPEIRYRWIGDIPGGDGANLLLHLHHSIYSKINSSQSDSNDNGINNQTSSIHYDRLGWKVGLEIQNQNGWGHSLVGFKAGQDFVTMKSTYNEQRLSRENQFAWHFSITYGQEFEIDL